MLLKLKDAFIREGYERRFAYPLDLSGIEMGAGEYPFQEPVNVSGALTNRAGVVGLSVKANFAYFTRCDRCCASLKEQMAVSFDNVLVKSVSGEGSDDFIVVQDEELDLDELVTTNILLDLPMKHLCSENCRGLCPICGKNLNDGPCGCKTHTDSGFSSLKNLIE